VTFLAIVKLSSTSSVVGPPEFIAHELASFQAWRKAHKNVRGELLRCPARAHMFTPIRGVVYIGARPLELHVFIDFVVCHNELGCEHDILKANGHHLQHGAGIADIEVECA
jgi:hypothetical protein